MLGWHVDSVVKCGLAGTIFFAWTDEWFTGEQEITDWAFGLVTRDREPKKVLSRPAGQTGPERRRAAASPAAADALGLGHRLFLQRREDPGACLESLGKIDYPNYEVILVDDGSTDNTQEIAARFPERPLHSPEQSWA